MEIKEGSGRMTAKYALLHGNYWMTQCAVLGYASVFLLSRGFSAGRIGILVGGGNIMAAVLQQWFASVADRTRKYTLKDLMICIAGICLIPSAVLLFLPGSGPEIAGMFILIIALVNAFQPLLNAVNGYYMKRGYSVNFGMARGIGSLSYAIFSLVWGYVVNALGENVIPLAITALLCLLIGQLLVLPMRRGDENREESGSRIKNGTPAVSVNFLKKYPLFFVLLAGIMMVFVFLNISNTYLIQIISRFGGGSADMGTSFAIAAVCELPMMFLFSKVVRVVRSNQLLRIGGFGFFLKAAATLAAGSVGQIHLSQMLQAVSFAVIIPASVYYADELMDENDRVRGQALITASTTIGGLVGSVAGGKLIDMAGVGAMLWAGLICAGAGMVLIWVAAVPAGRRNRMARGGNL